MIIFHAHFLHVQMFSLLLSGSHDDKQLARLDERLLEINVIEIDWKDIRQLFIVQ